MAAPTPVHRSLLVALSALLTSAAHAQGGTGLAAVAASPQSEEGRSPRSVASNNEWIVGTQFGVRFIGEGDFADNLLASGLVRYEIPLKSTSFGLPVFSNLGDIAAKSLTGTKADSLKSAASALLSTAQGMNVGLYPYSVLSNTMWGGDLRITAFGQVVGKVNTLQGRRSLTAPDTAAKVGHTMLQGRGALGLEFAIGTPDASNPARRPLTLSLTTVATTFSGRTYELVFGERKSWIPSIEFSAVVPIRDGAGVLFEGIGAPGHASTWRVGMVVGISNQAKTNSAGPGQAAENRDPPATQNSDKQVRCLNLVRATVRTEISRITDPAEKERAEQERLTDEALKTRQEFAQCMAQT